MNNKGFISTTLIYSFFILLLLLMLLLIGNYSSSRNLLEKYKDEIKKEFVATSTNDIKINYMVWNSEINEYIVQNDIPIELVFQEDISYCNNGATITFEEGNINASGTSKDICFAYFK